MMTVKELIGWLKDFEELEGDSVVKIVATELAVKDDGELMDIEAIVGGDGVVTLIADF